MKVIIFHGWGGNSHENWFPWLKKELKKEGIDVLCPDLPNSNHPNQQKWMDEAIKLSAYDEDTILVGHSLGAALILRLLEQNESKIKAAFLVSAFDRDLGISDIADFFRTKFEYKKIKKNAEKIFILQSDNDPYIKMHIAEELAEKLDCRLLIFNNKEHLSAGTDNFTFKELRDMILNELNKNN
jgi:uncharacterized protein